MVVAAGVSDGSVDIVVVGAASAPFNASSVAASVGVASAVDSSGHILMIKVIYFRHNQ